jgi:phosphopantetheinyl transferase (holo-ACP synthase)
MSDVLEINVPTGERIKRDFTAEELAQREKDQAQAAAAAQAAAEKEAVDKAAREATIAHAKSLGFTDEMIAVMYPNLVQPDPKPEPETD